MNRVFVTADMHYGHTNIIKYESRPFNNAEDMDAALIKNWNKVVSKNDKVFVLGDVSFHNKEKTAEIVQQLHGRKFLVKGNHDQRNNQWFIDVGFDEVSSYPIIYKDWFVMQHEPPHYVNDAMPFFFLYGHVHASEPYRTVTKTSACVSVERWEYSPVEIEKIVELAKLV